MILYIYNNMKALDLHDHQAAITVLYLTLGYSLLSVLLFVCHINLDKVLVSTLHILLPEESITTQSIEESTATLYRPTP